MSKSFTSRFSFSSNAVICAVASIADARLCFLNRSRDEEGSSLGDVADCGGRVDVDARDRLCEVGVALGIWGVEISFCFFLRRDESSLSSDVPG